MMQTFINHLKTGFKNRSKKGLAMLLLYLLLKWTLILTIGQQLLSQPWWKAQYALFLPLAIVSLLLIKRFRKKSVHKKRRPIGSDAVFKLKL